MKHVQAGVALGLVCLLFARPALATDVEAMSLNETIRQADVIVLGVVTAGHSRWGDASHRWIATEYTFRVEEILHAPARDAISSTITLTWWGGTVGQERQSISDLRHPVAGERLLLMLRPGWNRERGMSPVVGFNDGFFSMRSAANSSPAVLDAAGRPLSRSATGAIVRRESSRRESGTSPDITLASFVTWLRANLESIKATPAARARDSRDTPKLYAGVPELPASIVPAPSEWTSPQKSASAESGAGIPTPPPTSGALHSILRSPAVPAQSRRVGSDYVSGSTAYLPIVVNQFPPSFAPWSPEDQYAMSFWNYYADVFRVYVTPTGTYGWPNDRFDLAGWPSSADLQLVYGIPWPANAIGVTFSRYDGSNRIIEADIAMNPAFGFTLDDEWVYDGGSAQGFRQVMTHELGHMHGLDHDFDYLSTMNYMPAPFRYFGFPYMDDAQGIRAEYPANAVSLTDLAVYLFYASGFQSVSDATYPSSVTPGGNLTVDDYHIENSGTTTINTPTIDWYLSAGRHFNGAYYYLGTSTYSSLQPFHYFVPSSVGRTFTVPANVPPGSYYLSAFIANDAGPSHFVFPFSNNYAFSRTQVQVACPSSPAAPTGVVATALSTTSVAVSWNPAACAATYDVYRNGGGGFVKIGSSSTTGYLDNAASAGQVYLYAVKALDAGSVASALSAPDVATTISFTDPTLSSGMTAVKAIHISELRTAVAALRTLAGYGAAAYTDPSILGGVTTAKSAHISELRNALDAARATLGLTALGYTDPSLVPASTTIKGAHIEDLRNGLY